MILTHADADHKGFAERLRAERDVPVLVHSATSSSPRAARRTGEAAILPYQRHPAAWRLIGALAAGGIPKNVSEVETFEDDAVLDVPGRPARHAPGHTHGSVAFHFERHGVLAAGDVLYGFGVLTGKAGSPDRAASVQRVKRAGARFALQGSRASANVVLFGHGEPWTQGVDAAVASARATGPV